MYIVFSSLSRFECNFPSSKIVCYNDRWPVFGNYLVKNNLLHGAVFFRPLTKASLSSEKIGYFYAMVCVHLLVDIDSCSWILVALWILNRTISLLTRTRITGSLTDKQRNWILKKYWKFQNVETIRKEWREAFKLTKRRGNQFTVWGQIRRDLYSEERPQIWIDDLKPLVTNWQWRIEAFDRSPYKSSLRASAELGIPRRSLGRLTKQLELKP